MFYTEKEIKEIQERAQEVCSGVATRLCADWMELQATLETVRGDNFYSPSHVAERDDLKTKVAQLEQDLAISRHNNIEINIRWLRVIDERNGFQAEALSALAERDQLKVRLAVKSEQLDLARLAIREIYEYMMNETGFSGDDMRCIISASSVVQLDAAKVKKTECANGHQQV